MQWQLVDAELQKVEKASSEEVETSAVVEADIARNVEVDRVVVRTEPKRAMPFR